MSKGNSHDPFASLALAVNDARRMPILHPKTNNPLKSRTNGAEAYIDLISSDSDRARFQLRETLRRRMAAAQRVGRARVTPEEQEAEGVDLLVSMTTGWLLLTPDGDPIDVPCTPENARLLYDDNRFFWIKRQVDEFTADAGNFMPNSSPT